MLRVSLLVPVVMSLAVILTACGDDDDSTAPTAAPTAAASAPAEASVTPASAAALCSSQKSLDGAPLAPGMAFALDIFQRWQLCNGGAAAGSGEKWLFHTDDGGKNWKLVSRTTLGNPPKQPGVGDLPNGNGVVQMLFVDAKTGFLGLNSPGANLWRSTDGGVSWTASEAIPAAEAVQSMTAAGGQVTVVTSSGKWVTTDKGAHWSKT